MTTERAYRDWFVEPRSLPEGITMRDNLAAEITAIHKQLRERKEGGAPEHDPAYASWRASAMHALQRKELALKRYRDWCHAKHQQITLTIAGLDETTTTEELLHQAFLLLRRLLRDGGYQSPCAEYTLLDAIRGRLGLT